MGSGYQTAFGNDALMSLLAQRRAAQIQAQLDERARADKLNQQGIENDFRRRQLDQQDHLRQDTLAEQKRQHDLADQDRNIGLGNTLAEQIPSGAFLPEGDQAVGMLRTAGRGSLLSAQPAVPAMGPAFEGPMQGGITTAEAAAGRPAGFLKTATAKQADTEADNQRQADALKQQGAMQDWRNSISQQLADMKAGQPQGGAPHYQLVPEVDPKTGAQTGRMLGYNSKTNAFEPIRGTVPTGTKANPGAAQATQHEQSKKDALGSLDQLDQSIDAASSLIGPGPGRISHIEQLVGNPDPRISALGTKLLLTKMQVDHAATGTVRAGASPQLLARWDNLLSQNLDAANLKAAVQAMREILGGQAAAPSGPKRVVYDMNGNPVKQ